MQYEYDPYNYILWEQFGRCGLATGQCHVPQNVFLVITDMDYPTGTRNSNSGVQTDACRNQTLEHSAIVGISA